MNNKKYYSCFPACIAFTALLFCSSACQNTGGNNEARQSDQQLAIKDNKEPKKEVDKSKSELLTDTAKTLAGINVDAGSKLAALQKSNSWQSHQKFYQNSWSKLDAQQLTKVRDWTKKELQNVNATSPTILYPFSGPDFLYSYSLFPKAKQFVLAGLEPVGNVPDFTSLNESQKNTKLQEARSSLYAILQFSFFRTNDMKVDLEKQGVLPILYVFLARTNNRIQNVQYIGLDKDGKVQQFAKGMVSGVKIAFIPEGETEARDLYYFSTDLSNDGLKKRPEFVKFVNQLDNKVTYLKAASYLMHNESFSEIKNLILADSNYLLQDDSGMPLRSFASSQWNLKFYGSYSRPIGLFSNSYQADLRKIYQSNNSIEPLNFGIGYKFGVNESNLMLAAAKKVASR
ncbi:hypothetical protein DSM106972_089760 [Dulcicalothrix desertica PCC 7102]|uniref:Lipoprotein n=1 Tax=Dulcicalothrix desertica PCC 7102 TaxID=232991 RepID=A0A3S1AMM8_9CYAN|nr:hypothetical protein [Dulcicalothrix desertica]RUS95620.1 hypothetical protein DSM106972_089760 [Dulcicalothrix desertica PCC 7102]TWH39954.1 hypothetical protein CAL7102_09236 [Dulcicalothrix desertica PCC 7102]